MKIICTRYKCLKLYNCLQIICIRWEYLKPYNWVRIICIRLEYLISYKGGIRETIQLYAVSKVKLSPFSRGRLEGSLFNSYYNEVLHSLPLICTLYCWVLSKQVSSTIFKVFGMTGRRIEPRFPGPLTNTWNRTTGSGLFVLDKNTWNHTTGGILFYLIEIFDIKV